MRIQNALLLSQSKARTAEYQVNLPWVGKFGLASYGYSDNPESEDWFYTARICHPDSLHEFCLKHVFLF